MRYGLAIAAFLIALGCRAEDPKPTDEIFKLPELKCAVVKTAPKIDGTLDDPAWKEAAVTDTFKLQEGSTAQGKTKLYVMRDEENLYVAIECPDKEDAIKSLKADATEHDQDDVWADDSVELFIDPTHKREHYYQFIINSKGVYWDAYLDQPKEPDKLWQPTCNVKCKVNKENWVMTLSVPFAQFDRTEKSDPEGAFNVAHTRTSESELTYWSPVFSSSSHTPEKFGKLLSMPDKPLKAPEKKEEKK